MTRAFSLLTVATLGLSACAPMKQATISTLGSTAVLGGGTYSTGGGITVAAQAQSIDGMTAICGVWAESTRQSVLTKHKARDVIETGTATLGGEVIQRGFGFMEKGSPSGTDYTGQRAGCALSTRPWQAGDEARPLSLRIPRQIVYRETGFLKTGPIVVFRPTGPGAG